MIRPGTYRESDGSAVAFQAAKRAWAEAARSALLRTATVYHGWISYGDLAEEVQRVSGIRTRALMHYWIGEVLGMVSHQCHARGEPLLSSLCVDASGSVGPGYRSLLSELAEPSGIRRNVRALVLVSVGIWALDLYYLTQRLGA
jgi:hypothetical protein